MRRLKGLIGKSGDRQVFQGFAPAKVLASLSFADVLEESTGIGYQRRFNKSHSLDFRKYIHRPGSASIPLTFNLRPEPKDIWDIKILQSGMATLLFKSNDVPVMSQVDCQHRIGCLADSEIELPFMCFLGLSLKEEMQIFNTINGKAKGLNSSLLDFHQTKLLEDVSKERPELYLAARLHEDHDSPWFQKLDLGGKPTVGMKRKASLRTMQNGILRFLKASLALSDVSIEHAYIFIRNFWDAVVTSLPAEWSNPRKHFLTKGIGVYALMKLAADLFHDPVISRNREDENALLGILSDYLMGFDWSNDGPLKGLGGESGASQAFELLKAHRFTQKALLAQ